LNSRLTGIHLLQVRCATHCATPPLNLPTLLYTCKVWCVFKCDL